MKLYVTAVVVWLIVAGEGLSTFTRARPPVIHHSAAVSLYPAVGILAFASLIAVLALVDPRPRTEPPDYLSIPIAVLFLLGALAGLAAGLLVLVRDTPSVQGAADAFLIPTASGVIVLLFGAMIFRIR